MIPVLHAKKFYGANWAKVFDGYLMFGYVYASPTCFVLARPFEDHWWIEYLAGDMKEALQQLPFWRKQIRFNRGDCIRCYWTATLVRKLLKSPPTALKVGHDSVQNGSPDAVLRRGWWRWEDKTASAARTHYCRRECGQEPDSGAAT